MDLVIRYTWQPIPAWLPASPAVVIVLMPSSSERGSSGIAIGSQRIGARGASASEAGAVRQSPMSTFSNSPQWFTVGRMRYSHERSLVVLGAVNGEPLSCSAYSPNGHF